MSTLLIPELQVMPLPAFDRLAERAAVRPRVLVVDREPLIRWSLCVALAAEGFEALPAANHKAAMRLAAEWPPPRVVLIDLRPEDEDGIEVVSAIRSVYTDCRFVLMTTTGADCPWQWIWADRVELIQKPFDLRKVVRLVERLAGAAAIASDAPVDG